MRLAGRIARVRGAAGGFGGGMACRKRIGSARTVAVDLDADCPAETMSHFIGPELAGEAIGVNSAGPTPGGWRTT